MRTNFVPIPALIAGAAFALLLSGAANAKTRIAQTTTTPNPFSDGSKPQPPQTRSATPEKAAPVQQPASAGQFSSEAEAKSHCPGDIVVWANTGTKVYHYAGNATYGKTKRGAFMCEKETSAAGIRAARNENRP
jgi:hypothetical protein